MLGLADVERVYKVVNRPPRNAEGDAGEDSTPAVRPPAQPDGMTYLKSLWRNMGSSEDAADRIIELVDPIRKGGIGNDSGTNA